MAHLYWKEGIVLHFSKKELINALVGRECLNNTSPNQDAVTLPTLEACHFAEDDSYLVLCSKM